MHDDPLARSVVLPILLAVVGQAAAGGASAAPLSVPRMAPGLTFIAPPVHVVLECPGVRPDRSWLATLGGALDDRGFLMTDRAHAPADGVAAVIRCVARSNGPPPAAASAAAPAAASAAPPATAPLVPATDSPAPSDRPEAPPPPPIVEVSAPLSDKDAMAVADRVASLVAPKGGSPRPVRVLFLVETASDTGRALLVQSSWVAVYARLSADFVDLTGLDRLPAGWLDSYDAVVLATDRLPRSGVDRLVGTLRGYVERGGALAAVGGIEDEELFPLFGIEKAIGEAKVEAYACEPTFLPGAKGLDPVLDPDGADTVPRYRLARDVRVLCRGGAGSARDVPLAFTVRRGKGAAIVWSGARLADKASRGLILLSILEVAPIPAAVLGALVFYADDCPLPMTNSRRAPADELYDLTDSGFYRTMWWPRMRALWEKHVVRPTMGFILTYDDRMPGDANPEGYTEPDGAPSLELARSIRDAGYEIGLHGYNHQSLSVGRNEWTVGWAGRAAMEEALRVLHGEYQRIFGAGAEPPVYVAPSNFIQKLGKEALRAVFPAITGIASQYQDEGPILGQEFGPDPDVPGLVDIPRVSSEHFLDGDNSQEVLDALVLPGIFSHFVHPDDFYDKERSRGATFDEMMRRLDDMLATVDQAYPFLQRMTGSELARYVPAWRKAGLSVLRDPSGLMIRAIDPPPDGLTILVRAPRGTKVRSQGACQEVFRATTESRYYYRVGSEACTITWQ